MPEHGPQDDLGALESRMAQLKEESAKLQARLESIHPEHPAEVDSKKILLSAADSHEDESPNPHSNNGSR